MPGFSPPPISIYGHTGPWLPVAGLTMVWRVAIAPGFWPGPVAPLAFAYGAVANRAPLARMGPVCPWPGRCPVAIAPVGLGRALGHIRGRAGPLAGCPGCQPCPRALARAVALGPLAPGRLRLALAGPCPGPCPKPCNWTPLLLTLLPR